MRSTIEARSTFFSILMRSIFSIFTFVKDETFKGLDDKFVPSKKSPVGIWDIITPWRITVDVETRRITIKKRNWYLIGSREDTFAFRSVKQVNVVNHLFGADMGIRLISGRASVYSIDKSSARQIKDMLLDPKWTKNDRDVAIDVSDDNDDI
jgi:hypothetical protein